MNTEVIGILAGSLSCLTFLPQVIKTYKAKSAKEISLSTFLIATTGTILWLVYAFLIDSFSLKFTNILVLILTLTMLYLKFKFNKKNDNNK